MAVEMERDKLLQSKPQCFMDRQKAFKIAVFRKWSLHI